MTASESCLDLIRRFESFAASAYLCPAGIWTIGYGHTGHVLPGDTVTRDQAEGMLLEDVRSVESQLLPLVAGLTLTQGQWDALVSLAFNCGARRLPVLAPKLWRCLRDGKREMAAAELLDINKAGGRELPGLTARRRAEQELFLS